VAEEPVDDVEQREILASEILDKISKCEPVEYDHAIIHGDLDVSKLNLPRENGKCIVKSLIKIRSSAIKGHIDFENIRFDEEVDLTLSQIDGWTSFSGAEFRKPVHLLATKLCGETYFKETFFCERASFVKAEFGQNPPYPPMKVQFTESKFKNCVYFMGARFNGESRFLDCQFNDKADFCDARFSSYVNFIRANFGNDACFIGSHFNGDVYFVQAQFDGIACFNIARFDGEVLTFKDARFSIPIDQEDACRRAKNLMERSGDREEAGLHFYREMDGKRKQKPWYIRYPEWFFIQLIFGYGVHPYRLMACWFGFVFLFAAIYSLGHGIDAVASQLKGNATLVDYIWFSIATAVTPGYAGYKPTPDFKLVAGLEAIIGTFMWAAFIATFSRKYMR